MEQGENTQKQKKKRGPELRINVGSPKTRRDLINIAKNFNVTLSEFLRPKLREIADSYPDRLKQAPTDY